jgi:predicted membrane protein (TIGR00267 family)
MEKLSGLLTKIRLYVQVTHLGDITRRYFVKNGMDGSLTVLGIILGAWTVRVEDPSIIIGAGFGACLAMGVSGLFGAYITEKAERKKQLKNLEESMLSELEGSLHQNASEFAQALVALVDGSSPALTAIVSLIPFIFTMAGLISIWDSYVISLVFTLMTLFALGLYLGRVAKERVWLFGLQMLAAGVVIAIIIFLVGGTQSF